MQLLKYAIWVVLAATLCHGASRQVPPLADGGSFHLPQEDLRLWNDPAFRKQFTQSYMAEMDIEPRLTEPERETMLKVLDLIAADKADEAIALLKKSLNEASAAVFDFTLGNLYFQKNQLDEAARMYEAAVKKHDKFRRAWRNLGILYSRRGEFARALPALSRVIELGGSDATTCGLLGLSYTAVGNHLSAESAFRMAILLDPATLDWKTGLARCLLIQERFTDAAALCRQLLDISPDQVDLWRLQAKAYLGLNQPLRAAEIYELINQLGQPTADVCCRLGDIYFREGLPDIALQSWLRAMELDPAVCEKPALSWARDLAARGAFEEMGELIEHMERIYGSHLNEEDPGGLRKLRARLALADASETDEDVHLLEEIVSVNPLDGEALILLGQHCGRTGDREQAVFYFERAAAIEACEARAKVCHAQLLIKKGRYEEALPLLKRAQQIDPRDKIRQYLEQVERIAKTR